MKRAITMRAALADPQLLGNALIGESWSTWRAFLIAAMGEPLTREEREVFKRFTGREREPGERIEEGLFLIGRRGGKDCAAAVVAAYLAALVDWSPVLARGERGVALCIGADTRQAKIQRDYVEGVFDSSPMLSGLVTSRTADALELSNNIVIEVRAANFRRLRGPTCVAVIGSEVAFWLDDMSANPDVEILNAVRPSLATTGGPLGTLSPILRPRWRSAGAGRARREPRLQPDAFRTSDHSGNRARPGGRCRRIHGAVSHRC
jgi:hypothetical protein